jgi:HEAT repeat protein
VSYDSIINLTGSVKSKSLKSQRGRASNGQSRDTARWKPGSFLKVIQMSTKRLYLTILILVIGCQQAGIGQNTPVSPQNTAVASQTRPDEQLEIFRNALLTDPNEEIRIKAAGVMLGSENPLARKILLEVLSLKDNSAARMAICKVLIRTRESQGSIPNLDDFIAPLLNIFDTEVAAEARLAAEATLLFEYDKIGPLIEQVVTDASKPVKTRLNAIQALRLRPDMMATIRLIKLVDDSDKQVSAEAEKALRSLGIPVGENYWTREQNIYELQRKGRDEFLREWLIRQETQMRQLRTKLNLWQGKYLSALNKIYAGINDDTERGKFLTEHLSDPEAVIKLWVLDKVHQWRVAPGTSRLPVELGPILLSFISDPDRDIRLRTARLLSLMVELNSAQQLLAQLETEKDEEVKIQLLDALGGACSYALLSPSSPVSISPEVRRQVLGLASGYLSNKDAAKAQKGAEVLKRLLKPEGLTPEEQDEYLGLLITRYNQQEKPDGTLRGELLSTMADLCAQGSACKAKAAELFGPLFAVALLDETDFVRETAVDGLIYIDPASALRRLRNNFVNDSSVELRKKIIGLAGEVGGKEDLDWLVEKIGLNSESGPAWQAMRRIFNGSDSTVLNEWTDKLIVQNIKTTLSDENKIAFLRIADAKATGENKPAMLKSVRENLAELYAKVKQFDRAADCFDSLYKAAQTNKEKDVILPKLLDAYLRGAKVELAAQLVTEYLAKGDLGTENAVVGTLDTYLNEPVAEANPNVVLKALSEIKPSEARPEWRKWLKSWTDRLSKSEKAEKPKEG